MDDNGFNSVQLNSREVQKVEKFGKETFLFTIGRKFCKIAFFRLKMASRIAAVVPAVLAPAALAVKQKMAKE